LPQLHGGKVVLLEATVTYVAETKLLAACQMAPGEERRISKSLVPTNKPGVYMMGTHPDLPQPWFSDRAAAVAHGKGLSNGKRR
jgi:hypothetical protein